MRGLFHAEKWGLFARNLHTGADPTKLSLTYNFKVVTPMCNNSLHFINASMEKENDSWKIDRVSW